MIGSGGSNNRLESKDGSPAGKGLNGQRPEGSFWWEGVLCKMCVHIMYINFLFFKEKLQNNVKSLNVTHLTGSF